MALTFPFDKVYSPILGVIYRPIARVQFFSRTKKRWYGIWMVVDTGADYTILPKEYSSRFGIDLEKDCRIFKTSGIGGEEKVYFLNRIKIKLGNWEKDIPVGFLNRNEIPPLLGRHKFLETFETTFSSNHILTFTLK